MIDCSNDCHKRDNCTWWSYDPDTKFCQLLEDCVYLDYDCAHCFSSERDCIDLPEVPVFGKRAR